MLTTDEHRGHPSSKRRRTHYHSPLACFPFLGNSAEEGHLAWFGQAGCYKSTGFAQLLYDAEVEFDEIDILVPRANVHSWQHFAKDIKRTSAKSIRITAIEDFFALDDKDIYEAFQTLCTTPSTHKGNPRLILCDSLSSFFGESIGKGHEKLGNFFANQFADMHKNSITFWCTFHEVGTTHDAQLRKKFKNAIISGNFMSKHRTDILQKDLAMVDTDVTVITALRYIRNDIKVIGDQRFGVHTMEDEQGNTSEECIIGTGFSDGCLAFCNPNARFLVYTRGTLCKGFDYELVAVNRQGVKRGARDFHEIVGLQAPFTFKHTGLSTFIPQPLYKKFLKRQGNTVPVGSEQAMWRAGGPNAIDFWRRAHAFANEADNICVQQLLRLKHAC